MHLISLAGKLKGNSQYYLETHFYFTNFYQTEVKTGKLIMPGNSYSYQDCFKYQCGRLFKILSCFLIYHFPSTINNN